jgi:uncharacterized protein (DUF58 family)
MLPSELIRKIRKIEITTRRMVTEEMAGSYHSAFKGRGIEFSEVRPYVAGDDIRSIDWNVTARSGMPHVKQFIEERELTVMLVVDASGSLSFGTRSQFKRELAAEFSALIAFSAIRNNDRVGLIVFTDRIEKFIPPQKGRKHVLRVIREILFHKPEGHKTDIAGAISYLRKIMRGRGVVFLVSDFDDGGFDNELRIAARRFDLIAVRMADRAEIELPRVGLLRVTDPESGRETVVDTSSYPTRADYAKLKKNKRAVVDTMFKRRRVDLLNVETGQDYLPGLAALFRRRSRRLVR